MAALEVGGVAQDKGSHEEQYEHDDEDPCDAHRETGYALRAHQIGSECQYQEKDSDP